MPDDPVVFDRQSAELIKTTVLAEMARIKNRLLPEGIDTGRRSSDQWVPFINASSATIPERAIMAVIGSTFDDETNTQFLKVNKPSTNFCARHAVNGALESTAGDSGLCAVYGPVQVLYEGSFTPTSTKSGGPKPGSWAINEGWPTAIDFFGTVDTTTKIAHGFLHPIDSVIGKTSAATTPGSTGTLSIWTSTSSGSEAVSSPLIQVGFRNRTSTTLPSSKYVEVVWRNGQAYGLPWECS